MPGRYNRADHDTKRVRCGARRRRGLRALFPSARRATAAAVRVNGDRLNARLAVIGRFGANPQGGVTRLGYSEEDRQARALVSTWMRDAGLEPATDFAGNLIGRRPGSDPGLKPLVFGSHVDSVPEGGNFDGNVGVLASIEVARTLREQARRCATRSRSRSGRTRKAASSAAARSAASSRRPSSRTSPRPARR
jgi:hypothetical protein